MELNKEKKKKPRKRKNIQYFINLIFCNLIFHYTKKIYFVKYFLKNFKQKKIQDFKNIY